MEPDFLFHVQVKKLAGQRQPPKMMQTCYWCDFVAPITHEVSKKDPEKFPVRNFSANNHVYT
jgi:hypothetical protein